METAMQKIIRTGRVIALLYLTTLLSGCSDPQVYASIGVSSGYSSFHGSAGSGPRMRGSISVGGRIR